MATAFNDSIRNQIDQERVGNERAVAAMQLLASMNQTGATRYGSDRTLDAARLREANESMRLGNLMTLGREQYGSQERVAGLGHTSAENLARLERESRLELGKLPYSPEAREHALEIARLGVRPDPYMTRDIGKANLESIELNDLAKSIAESANLTIDREEAELLKNLPGWDRWDRDTKIKDGLTRIITGLDAKLGENRQLLEFVPATNRYKPRVRAIIPIPNGQAGPPPTGLPAVPPIRQNRAMMEDSVPIVPTPVPYGPTSGTYSPPLGQVAVPVARAAPATAPTNVPWLNGILNAYKAIQGPVAMPASSPTAPPVAPSRVFTSEAEARAAGIGPGQEFILIQNGERWRARLR